MVRICIRMLQICFERCKFAFECFDSLSKSLNLHTNASNAFRMDRICIRMLWIWFKLLNLHSNVSNVVRKFRIWFEWLEFPFECFESLSNCSNMDSNSSNLVRMARICIGILFRISSEWFKYAFEYFKYGSNDRISIWMLQVSFEGWEFAYECFESLSNHSNLHSKASPPNRMVRIYIRMLRIHSRLEFAFECFESHSKA